MATDNGIPGKLSRGKYILISLILWFALLSAHVSHAFMDGCSGKTVPGQTNWKAYGSSGLYVDVDTSNCKDLGEDVIYFTSIESGDGRIKTRGETSIYDSTENSLRIFIYSPGITPQLANAYGWVINWMKYRNNARPSGASKVCSGHTSATNSNWQYYSSAGKYLDIDTSQCNFSSTPYYFTSLGGNASHWTAIGTTAIYSADKNSFRTYINRPGISPNQARSKRWHMNWIAIDKSDNCAGASHRSDWRRWSSNWIYVDVDTTSCGLNYTPNYLTAIHGQSNHWTTQNSSFITNATPTGFRVYVYQAGVTVEFAESKKWSVHWAVMRENTPPVAGLWDNPWYMTSSNGLINNSRYFSSTSVDAEGDLLTEDWQFGDGGTATGRYASHVFSQAGVYNVDLSANDGLESSSVQTTVHVYAEVDVQIHCDYIIENQTASGATARIELSNYGLVDIEDYIVYLDFVDSYSIVNYINIPGLSGISNPTYSLTSLATDFGRKPGAGMIPAGGHLTIPIELVKRNPNDGVHQVPLISGDICTVQ